MANVLHKNVVNHIARVVRLALCGGDTARIRTGAKVEARKKQASFFVGLLFLPTLIMVFRNGKERNRKKEEDPQLPIDSICE